MSCSCLNSILIAVKEAVKHIEQAPFLQLHQGLSSTRHDISDAVLRDSQVNLSEISLLARNASKLPACLPLLSYNDGR